MKYFWALFLSLVLFSCSTQVGSPSLENGPRAVVAWEPQFNREEAESRLNTSAGAGELVEEIRKVKVLPGGSVAKYVKRFRSRGADLPATMACNGWKPGSTPVLQPGQIILICR